MAVADLDTWGLLNRWPVIMLESEYHWNQAAGQGAPLTQPCDEIYVSTERGYIADALNDAVGFASELCGFYPRPTFRTERLLLRAGVPLEMQRLRLPRGGYLQAIGTRATTLIQANVAIAYSDSDGDGFLDLAAITVTTTVDADEIQIFFRTADGASAAADELWRIEPVKVVKSGNTATITAPRALFVEPSFWNLPFLPPNYLEKNAANTANAADFVTQVDVYRVYADSTGAVTFYADPYVRYGGCEGCDGDIADGACLRVYDSQLGFVMVRPETLAEYNCNYFAYEAVEISFLAGYPLTNQLMDRRLEKSLIRFANTLVPQKPCNFCDRTLNMWDYDRNDLKPEELTPQLMGNPFGLKRGQAEAFKVFQDRALGAGGKLTQGRRW